MDITEAKLQEKYNVSELKNDYKLQKASLIKEAINENAIQIEIGDKTKNIITHEITIQKWDGEVKMKIKPKFGAFSSYFPDSSISSLAANEERTIFMNEVLFGPQKSQRLLQHQSLHLIPCGEDDLPPL